MELQSPDNSSHEIHSQYEVDDSKSNSKIYNLSWQISYSFYLYLLPVQMFLL